MGSIDEEDDEQGIAHMIEHVAFLGSKKREKLLGTGARSNAYTDFHHTVFHIHSPTLAKVRCTDYVFVSLFLIYVFLISLSMYKYTLYKGISTNMQNHNFFSPNWDLVLISCLLH